MVSTARVTLLKYVRSCHFSSQMASFLSHSKVHSPIMAQCFVPPLPLTSLPHSFSSHTSVLLRFSLTTLYKIAGPPPHSLTLFKPDISL